MSATPAGTRPPYTTDCPETIDAYGMQREICARAVADAAGQPRQAPLDPVGATLRITGPLSVPHLARAVELVTERADTLRGRLRLVDGRFVFQRRPGPAAIPVTTVDLRRRTPGQQRRAMAEWFQQGAQRLADMQDGARGLFVVAVLADDDHVMYARFDHAHVDHQAMHALLRRVGRVYGRLVDGEDPTPDVAGWHAADFFDHARGVQSDVDARQAAERFWRPLVRDSRCELALPGRSWRSWRQRRATGNLSWVMPEADARTFGLARRVTGSSQMNLFLAALSVVTAGATGTGFLPLTYHRHGREAAEPLIGPWWDTFITVAPHDPGEGLAGWMTGFAATNAHVPSMSGLALVDFASLDKVMELRRFTVNVLVPPRPLFLGPLRAAPYLVPGGVPSPITGIKQVKHNVGIRLFALRSGGFRATLNYDPDDYADGERIFTATCHVLRRLVECPGLPVDQARAEALGVLTGTTRL